MVPYSDGSPCGSLSAQVVRGFEWSEGGVETDMVSRVMLKTRKRCWSDTAHCEEYREPPRATGKSLQGDTQTGTGKKMTGQDRKWPNRPRGPWDPEVDGPPKSRSSGVGGHFLLQKDPKVQPEKAPGPKKGLEGEGTSGWGF